MKEHVVRQFIKQGLLVLLLALLPGGVAVAVTSKSPSYQVIETQFNSGMTIDSCSGEYCAQATIGGVVAGESTSRPSGATATFSTTLSEEPLLEVIVEPGESDLGTLTTEKTATKTAVVRIRSYLSDGYVLQVVGDPPTYGDYALRTPASPEESKPGTELFAINVVANTVPGVGKDPAQVPSEEMSFGEAAEGYNMPNFFKYRSGDVVGQSFTESGQTDYTISMIVNVSGNTPAGHYTGDYAAVVVPLY